MLKSPLERIIKGIKEMSNKARVKIEDTLGIENYYRVKDISKLKGGINTGEYYFTVSLLRRSTNERIEMEYKYDLSNREVKILIKGEGENPELKGELVELLTKLFPEKTKEDETDKGGEYKEGHRIEYNNGSTQTQFIKFYCNIKKGESLIGILNLTQKYFDPKAYERRITSFTETFSYFPFKW